MTQTGCPTLSAPQSGVRPIVTPSLATLSPTVLSPISKGHPPYRVITRTSRSVGR